MSDDDDMNPSEWTDGVLTSMLGDIAKAGHDHTENGGSMTDSIGRALTRAETFISHELTSRILMQHVQLMNEGKIEPEVFGEVVQKIIQTGRAF